jgi:uncharacterized delta-60 repeat protein
MFPIVSNAEPKTVVRLNADGSLDVSFTLPDFTEYNHAGRVWTLAPDGAGGVLVGGAFQRADGVQRNGLARLLPNGSLELLFVPEINVNSQVSAVVVQPDDRLLVSGWLTDANGWWTTNTLARLNADGRGDESFVLTDYLEGGWTSRFALALEPDGQILLGATRGIIDEGRVLRRLNPDGSRDTAWFTRIQYHKGDGHRVTVRALALQPDGRVLAGGWFASVNDWPRPSLARFGADGEPDVGFYAPLAPYAYVESLALQPDGKVLVAGPSVLTASEACTNIGLARLNPNGSVDATFNFFGTSPIHCVSLLPDGRILIGGEFIDDPGGDEWQPPRLPQALARLCRNGSVDSSFQPIRIPAGDDCGVRALAQLPDGRLLIGGLWPGTDEGLPPCLARLNADGSLDASFQQNWVTYFFVKAIALQADGKAVVGGSGGIETPGGYTYVSLLRVNPDGSLDASFHAEMGALYSVSAVVWQPDGKILVGDSEAGGILRLNPDGSRDSTFDTRIGRVHALLLQPDHRILVGGEFEEVNGLPAIGLARLNNDISVPLPFVRREISPPSVRLIATPPAGVSVYAVEDQPPANWPVTNISHGGLWDAATGKVKFGPFYDAEPRTLSYTVIIPPCWPPCPGYFTGTASADGVNTPIVGDGRIVQPWPHPADVRSPEWSLSIGEVTVYGAAWRRGDTWPLPPNPIPIDYVTRAAMLWRGGECYRFDDRTNAPFWWVNCDAPGSADFQSAVAQVSNLPAAQRELPGMFVPGEPLTVTIATHPGGATRAYAVEDAVPTGWPVSAISPGGELDAVNGKVKWGPFLDAAPRDLSYQVVPPAGASGVVTFAGTASFDGAGLPVAGPRQISAGSRLRVALDPATGRLVLSLVGPAGSRYLIETSTDLSGWLPLSEVTASPDGTTLPLNSRPEEPQRFYRAQLIP